MRSRRSDQPQRTHDGRTCRAVFLARRIGGGWPNEGAVVRQLGRPAFTARTGSPGLGCEDTYATELLAACGLGSFRICRPRYLVEWGCRLTRQKVNSSHVKMDCIVVGLGLGLGLMLGFVFNGFVFNGFE